jgi:hypothetical protein
MIVIALVPVAAVAIGFGVSLFVARRSVRNDLNKD